MPGYPGYLAYAPRAEAEGGRTCLPQWARVRRVAASACWLTACWLTACCLSVPARAGCYVPQQAGGCGRLCLQAGGEADLEAVLVPAGATTTERQPAGTVASSRTGRRTRHRRTLLQDRRSRQDPRYVHCCQRARNRKPECHNAASTR